MTFVGCSIAERFVNPLFEVFDGGDLILSSYRDIEEPLTQIRIYLEDAAQQGIAREALAKALAVIGVQPTIETGEIADEDWRFAYRRHFKTELVSPHIYTVPEWETADFFASSRPEAGKIAIVSDPGMAFGTGKHETTKACLQFIDELSSSAAVAKSSLLDMGCGSGILSIAAAKFGFKDVEGFDVDQEAVDASIENAAKNEVAVKYYHFALGRAGKGDAVKPQSTFEVVVANILGPLLIRFAEEIVPYCRDRLILSGILSELYPEVRATYVARGFVELGVKTIGEWTTGLFRRA